MPKWKEFGLEETYKCGGCGKQVPWYSFCSCNPVNSPMDIVDQYHKDKIDPFKQQVGGGHYKSMKIQPIEFILGNELGFCEGNIIKYTCRYKQKGGVEDLKKVIHYAELLIAQLEKEDKT
jgi:hypothetical protein